MSMTDDTTMPDASSSGMMIAACLSRAITDRNDTEARAVEARKSDAPNRADCEKVAAFHDRYLSALETYILNSPIRDEDDALLRIVIVNASLCGGTSFAPGVYDMLRDALDNAATCLLDMTEKWQRPAFRALRGYYLAQHGCLDG